MTDDPTDEREDGSDTRDTDESATPTERSDPDHTTTESDDTTMTDTETEADIETDTDSENSGLTGDRVRRGLNYLLLAGLSIFALVAAVGFYTAASSAISTWVTSEYRPLVRAAFNLVVLLVVGAAIVRQARRLS